jgi:hypothetical protein
MSEFTGVKKHNMQVQHSGSFYQNFGGINFMDAHSDRWNLVY